jgi:diguanylate cyclase (GGDEF)-like protein
MGNLFDSNSYDNNSILSTISKFPGGFLVYTNDEDRKITYFNEKVIEILEYSGMDEFLKACRGSFNNIPFHRDLEIVNDDIQSQLLKERDYFDHINFRVRTGKGNIIFVEAIGAIEKDAAGNDVVCLFLINSSARYLMFDNDHLTGLLSMKRFLDITKREMDMNNSHINVHKKDYKFIYFDIRKFKLFNVKYGIEAGNRILKIIAGILSYVFVNDFVSRFSDDHFVIFTDKEDMEACIKDVHKQCGDISLEPKLELKAGICRLNDFADTDGNVFKTSISDPAIACDYAKMACDRIKNISDIYFMVYSPEIQKELSTMKYTSDNIDAAIENGYIKVYYQPVIRTISGNLCGLEALARWDDPKYGLLSPAMFIPALEESNQIYKLDSFIVSEICRRYRYEVDHGRDTVPVSFNLSKLDFLACDIFNVVEAAVEKYQVPRDMLHVEITESIFINDRIFFDSELKRFHDHGYQVWMDDFGSGYSSLNVLKDYKFDELKIDMEFLSSFTKVSQDIIKSTVEMAKRISMQTLAEGVETLEQFNFLKNIGCEKTQGYYFGKPLPYEETMANMKKKGIAIENTKWRHYFDKIGGQNIISDSSLAIFEFNGNDFRFLFVNEAYMDVLKAAGTESIEKVYKNMNSKDSPLYRLFRKFVAGEFKDGEIKDITYPAGESFLNARVSLIARCENYSSYRVTITDISQNELRTERQKIDDTLRTMYLMLDHLFVMDISDDSIISVDTTESSLDGSADKDAKHGEAEATQKIRGVKDYLRNEIENIHPLDRDRFLEFTDPATIYKRIENNSKSFITDYFLQKNETGNYAFYLYVFMMVPKTEGRKYIGYTKLTEAEKMTGYLGLTIHDDNDFEKAYESLKEFREKNNK